jgi:hypothetical protein
MTGRDREVEAVAAASFAARTAASRFMMLARLGRFLYWLGCGLTVVAVVSGVFALQHGPDYDYRWVVYVASILSAVLFWLIGRACKYFLAGE